jgi:hypothetical protein
MKHNLGKIVLLFLGFTFIFANDFNYKITVDKTNPYIKEAVILTVDINQTNHDIVLLFDFDLLKNNSYSFQRIDIKEIDAYHAVQIQYTYLIYPLKEGDINIDFHLTQKATTDESVAYSFSGDRDNVKGLVTVNTKIDLAPLTLKVKPLPKNTQIVGDFSLDYKIKTLHAQAFEPIPLQVTLKGIGYPPLLENLLPSDNNITHFTETPLVTSFASRKGTHVTVTYPMALSHDKSFTLNPIIINAFNPTTKTSYTLTVPEQHFNISKIDKASMIDKIDTPSALKADWSWLKTLFGYIIVFFAGYLSALSWKLTKKKKHKEYHPWVEKIQSTKTSKELLQLLMAKDSKAFTSCIEKLEASIYGNENIHLGSIKKEVLEKIKYA